jgi:YD repeat-containing protein
MPAQGSSNCHRILAAQRGATVVWRYEYDQLGRLTDEQTTPGGEEAPTDADFGVPRGTPFVAADFPADAGLAYHRWRHYDPTPGVWLGEDGPVPAG